MNATLGGCADWLVAGVVLVRARAVLWAVAVVAVVRAVGVIEC